MSDNAKKKFETLYETSKKLLPDSQNKIDADSIEAHQARMAIILITAALDTYFTEKFMSHLVGYLKKHQPNERMKSIIIEAGLKVEECLDCLGDDTIYECVRKKVKDHLKVKGARRRWATIDDLYEAYELGYLTKKARSEAKTKNPDWKNIILENEVNDLLAQRNEIAHEGDLKDETNYNDINIKKVRLTVEFFNEFVSTADTIINNHMSTLKRHTD